MKRIVTHINPDLDAVASAWLIKRFLPGWENAEVSFCQAGSTFENKPVDSDPEVLHVDVGLGKLDHHQTNGYLSAAKLVWDFIKKEREKKETISPLDEKAIERLIEVVTQIDNAHNLSWKEAREDRYYFYLDALIEGLRRLSLDDLAVFNEGSLMLETVLVNLKAKIRAEEKIGQAIKFKSPWGEALALETGNKEFLHFAQAQGHMLVVIKDPDDGGVRIYSRPDSKVDLTKTYNQLRKLDSQADWFLHASKRLLLNSASAAKMKPTKLSLEKVIEVLKNG